MLLLLLFNFCGYRFVLNYLQQQSAVAVEQRVDNRQYTETDLLSIKTPLHLPYYTGSETFERVYGSITVDGIEYEYVKRRVLNDTLELLCLPNKAMTALKQTGNDWAKAAADGQANSPQKKGAQAKLSFSDYVAQPLVSFVLPLAGCATANARLAVQPCTPGYAAKPTQPPRVNA